MERKHDFITVGVCRRKKRLVRVRDINEQIDLGERYDTIIDERKGWVKI
jgi:hypothetical protein